ncbi:hypothetical protein PA10_00134 [Pseudomonas phage pPa_SNUABM_DT01]|nr:hypothetical protein PA10_00134 [Pseudomonas phage pPa_SNUABM_DT01]
MNIEFKGPTALIFDVSALTGTLDIGGMIPPLAWQFVIEQDLIEKVGLTMVSTTPHCPSLENQYSLIRKLQDRYEQTFVDQLDQHLTAHLRLFGLSIEMTLDYLVVFKENTLRS